jgi:NAD(P)-dependent dehydrogenase (short-subunit alcohol dehydrogenase family)
MRPDTSITLRHRHVKSLDLDHLRIAIVGGTSGIGRSLARSLAGQGARITVVGRTFKDRDVPNIDFVQADLSLIRDARRVAAELPVETLDMVIMTTGIMAGPQRETTSEGIERDLAVSYLSRYAILNVIAPRLGKDRSEPRMRARVFVMGYPGSGQSANAEDLNSERAYKRMVAHSNTVAGNEALVLEAAERFSNIDMFGLNPGFVKTGIRSNLFGSKLLLTLIEAMTSFMTIKPEIYAERIAPLLASPDIEGCSSAMFDNKPRAILPSKNVAEPTYMRALIAASEKLVQQALAKS